MYRFVQSNFFFFALLSFLSLQSLLSWVPFLTQLWNKWLTMLSSFSLSDVFPYPWGVSNDFFNIVTFRILYICSGWTILPSTSPGTTLWSTVGGRVRGFPLRPSSSLPAAGGWRTGREDDEWSLSVCVCVGVCACVCACACAFMCLYVYLSSPTAEGLEER